MPYFEKTVETTVGLVEHSYEGVRKAAIGTLWRSYACLFGLMEDHTGEKWTPGLPLKSQPSEEVLKLGEVVTAATLSVWDDEVDRYVLCPLSFLHLYFEMMNNLTLYPAHSETQVVNAANAYQHSDLLSNSTQVSERFGNNLLIAVNC